MSSPPDAAALMDRVLADAAAAKKVASYTKSLHVKFVYGGFRSPSIDRADESIVFSLGRSVGDSQLVQWYAQIDDEDLTSALLHEILHLSLEDQVAALVDRTMSDLVGERSFYFVDKPTMLYVKYYVETFTDSKALSLYEAGTKKRLLRVIAESHGLSDSIDNFYQLVAAHTIMKDVAAKDVLVAQIAADWRNNRVSKLHVDSVKRRFALHNAVREETI